MHTSVWWVNFALGQRLELNLHRYLQSLDFWSNLDLNTWALQMLSRTILSVCTNNYSIPDSFLGKENLLGLIICQDYRHNCASERAFRAWPGSLRSKPRIN